MKNSFQNDIKVFSEFFCDVGSMSFPVLQSTALLISQVFNHT